MVETLRHSEAFELYYTMGLDRSYEKVALEFGVSVGTVTRWGKHFNWRERVKERDSENAKRLATITDNTVIEDKLNYRKILKASIATYVNGLKDGTIVVDNVKDFATLLKLDLDLMNSLVVDETADDKIEIIFEGVGVSDED